jgi:hypothetical protein
MTVRRCCGGGGAPGCVGHRHVAGVCIQVLAEPTKYSLVTDMLLTVLFVICSCLCCMALQACQASCDQATVKTAQRAALAQKHHGALTWSGCCSALTLEQAAET